MNSKTKKLTAVAMLAAIAYVVMFVGRIPISSVDFLKYDPKDVIITIGGFIYGPLTSLAISLVVSLVEMLTVSTTGVIGALMNVVSTVSFACTASLVYKRKRTALGAVLGLTLGVILTTVLMLLWNYFITPLYMLQPREVIASMLLPVFLPFNLLKCGLNMAITLLLYKPIVTAMRRAKLVDASSSQGSKGRALGITVFSLILLVTLVMIVLIIRKVI